MKHIEHIKTDLSYRNAKPREREYTILDGEGLFMIVQPSGSKYWIFRSSFGGKRFKIHLGTYPEVPLRGYFFRNSNGPKIWVSGARDSAEDLRRSVAAGIDPRGPGASAVLPLPSRETPETVVGFGVNDVLRSARSTDPVGETKSASLFRVKAEEWLQVQSRAWSESNQKDVRQRLEKDINPVIGSKPVREVGEADALRIFNTISDRRSDVLAVRVVEYVERILRFSGCDGFKVSTLRERGYLMRRRPVRHHPACSRVEQFADLLRRVEAVENRETLKLGIKLLALFFCRPGALQTAEWSEIDFRSAEWIIPGHRTGCKRKKYELDQPHLVPLSRQALEILRRLHELSAGSRYVLPSRFQQEAAISNAAFGTFLKQLGYKDKQTPHGFRACARTLMREELDIPIEVIEAQLGHASMDRNGRAYDRTEFIRARRESMQKWADFIDQLTDQRIGVQRVA